MITNTKERIIDYIISHGQARVVDLHRDLKISTVAVHKQLKKLVGSGALVRLGKPPIVFYSLPSKTARFTVDGIIREQFPLSTVNRINDNFLSITPDGKLLYGMEGLEYWASIYQKNVSLENVAKTYINTLDEQSRLRDNDNLIEARSKLIDTFGQTPITHFYIQDIYSVKTFGRTKLAKLVMYAKQTGEKRLINEITDGARQLINLLIKKYNIDAVAFIPPTVPRPLQFISELDSRLNLPLPEIQLVKVIPGDIPVPQKTLSTLEERVINARDSIFIKNINESKYRNVLLIDDVAGSGASFQETAKKLASIGIGEKNIIAFAFVGNIKGYEVIREI